jgi:hypothetical protein
MVPHSLAPTYTRSASVTGAAMRYGGSLWHLGVTASVTF